MSDSRRACFPLSCCVVACLLGLPGCRREEPALPTSRPTATQPGRTPGSVERPCETPLPQYAKYLAGLRICLDPGHGGDASRPNYKRGPTGLREAEVNLRVGLFLKDLLEASGAKVFMTRQTDVALADNDEDDLRLRAEFASNNACDLLLSIHHNANDQRPQANFATVWYHGQIANDPASVDIARHVATALIDELRLPEQVGVPVLSDELIYPKSGFRLLRLTQIPAVLAESSFHTNPAEEARLRDPDYNRREARALFTGLARYAYYGVPRASLLAPANGRVPASGPAQVVLELDDGLKSRQSWGWQRPMIFEDSVNVRIGDTRWPVVFDRGANRLSLYLPVNRRPGPLVLDVQFENMFKHSNTRPRIVLQVAPDGAETRP